jgi:hypothetical protein
MKHLAPSCRHQLWHIAQSLAGDCKRYDSNGQICDGCETNSEQMIQSYIADLRRALSFVPPVAEAPLRALYYRQDYTSSAEVGFAAGVDDFDLLSNGARRGFNLLHPRREFLRVEQDADQRGRRHQFAHEF